MRNRALDVVRREKPDPVSGPHRSRCPIGDPMPLPWRIARRMLRFAKRVLFATFVGGLALSPIPVMALQAKARRHRESEVAGEVAKRR